MEVSIRLRHPVTFRVISAAVNTLGTVNSLLGICWHLAVHIMHSKTFYQRFGYSAKYIGFWGLIVFFIYHAVGIIGEISACMSHQYEPDQLWYDMKASLRTSLAFPMAMVNCVAHWFLVLVRKRTDEKVEIQLPPMLRLVANAAPLLLIVLDCVSSESLSPEHSVAMIIITIVFGTYMIWITVVFFITNQWVYGLLGALNLPLMLLFYLSTYLIYLCFYSLGKTINDLLWDEELASKISPCLVHHGVVSRLDHHTELDEENPRTLNLSGPLKEWEKSIYHKAAERKLRLFPKN